MGMSSLNHTKWVAWQRNEDLTKKNAELTSTSGNRISKYLDEDFCSKNRDVWGCLWQTMITIHPKTPQCLLH